MGRPLFAQGRAARSMGQALCLQVARRERRLRPAFLRQGRLARRHGRERRPHQPLAMRYQLKAIGPGGGVESIDSQAPDETTAVRQLEGRGYTVLSVRAKHTLGTPWGARSRRFPVALFSQELRVLINAGLPLLEAIDTLGQKERSNEWRGVIERLGAGLREGPPLSAALEQVPQAFSPPYIPPGEGGGEDHGPPPGPPPRRA